MSEHDLIGTKLADRFQIQRLLGTGGVGEVYLAEHDVLGVTYAVKVLQESLTGDARMVERFRREAYAASRLSHPNIVGTIDFGRTSDGKLYLVMEYVEGQSLTELLAEHAPRPVPRDRAIRILRQIGLAVQVAHDADVVHRDLKPDNVLLTRGRSGEDLVKILDFGLAKVLSADGEAPLTQVGEVFGTPRYMSPEQAAGKPVDHRSDLYALGVLGYELFTGRAPFEHESIPQLLMAHLQERPPLPSALLPIEAASLPSDLEDLLLRCLEKEPGDRPRQAAEIVSVLEGIMEAEQPPEPPSRAVPQDVSQVLSVPDGAGLGGGDDPAPCGDITSTSGASPAPCGDITSTGGAVPGRVGPCGPLPASPGKGGLGPDGLGPGGLGRHPAAARGPGWLPGSYAPTVRADSGPLDLPSARPEDPHYRAWYWSQAVKLATMIARRLLDDGQAEAGLAESLTSIDRAEDRTVGADAEVVLADSRLDDLDRKLRMDEARVRNKMVDLTMGKDWLFDGSHADPEEVNQLRSQIREHEEQLAELYRLHSEAEARLEAEADARMAEAEAARQAQLQAELALMGVLDRARPDPLPWIYKKDYVALAQMLRALRQR